jgi:trimethylamine:corrinoid methyltransferase-like protein
MRRITPRLTLDLTEGDLDRIEERAAVLLEHVGLAVQLEEARRRMVGAPGADVRGERVHFRADAILDLLRAKAPPRRRRA